MTDIICRLIVELSIDSFPCVLLLLGSGGHIRPSAAAQPGILRPKGEKALAHAHYGAITYFTHCVSQ